jgi:hypothetical protein
MSYENRLKCLNLPTLYLRLYYIRSIFDQIQLLKIIHSNEKVDIDKFLTLNDNIARGHIYQILKVRCKNFPLV